MRDDGVIQAVHQFVPCFEPGAVGASICNARETLREAGYRSEIFADEIDGRFSAQAGVWADRYEEFARPGDIIVYHLAIGAVMADWVRARPELLVIIYHNITPAGMLQPWDPELGRAALWGRRQLVDLAPRAALGIGCSSYSEAELIESGYRLTAVVPVLFDSQPLATADPGAMDRLVRTKRGHDWIFVSRIAPNKAQHDLVRAFALYRQFHDPNARLWLPGGSSSQSYLSALRAYIEALGLSDAIELPGAVSASELAAYYEAADVFVCLSEHEGFGVPLLEAWSHDLPVVAYARAAVTETAGDAAILLKEKSAATVSAAVARVMDDPMLRSHLIGSGRRRLLGEFEPRQIRVRLVEAISAIGSPR